MVFDPERVQFEAEIARLQAIVEAQAALIAELRSKLEQLQARLSQDSSNSSVPPSRDGTDRRARRAAERAERKAADKAAGKAARSPGKQKGAPGSTLCRRSPDRTVIHAPSSCGGCGADLANAPVVGQATRQVLEIPEPRLEAIDHVVQRRRCRCGHETRAEFPPEATAPVCWGPRAKASAAYLLGRQHLPLERGAEAMAVLFGAPMGEGTLAGILLQAAGALESFEERLKALLDGCPVVHADETSLRVGVGLNWVHTVSSPGLSFLALHQKRGIEAIVEIGVLGGYTGTIVHDGFVSYDQPELAGATHAQCGAHLVRHLDKLAEHPSQTPWAMAMKGLLCQARDASEEAGAAGLGAVPDPIASRLRDRYRQILHQGFAHLPPAPAPWRRHRGGWTNAERDAWNLATRLRAKEDQVLALLADTRIPFTNYADVPVMPMLA